MITNRGNSPHYTWADICDGWHLTQAADLHVISERMPAGTTERRHYHARARQFFYVLNGTLSMEHNGTVHRIPAGSGLEIHPGVPHRAFNDADEPTDFLVISAPSTRGDRVDL